MINKNEILVTVVVLTYNSESTIEETLDSIFRQTYHNIELVIADDCSKDNTVQVIEKWVERHHDRFFSVKTLFNEVNLGVSENANIAVQKSEGEWIVLFAGDDLMLPDFVICNIEKTIEQPENKIFQSKQYVINGVGEIMSISTIEHLKMLNISNMSIKEQYQYLLFDDIKLSASMFFEKKAFQEIGGCNSAIRNIEDYPLKLNFVGNGYGLGYVDRLVIKYRVHDSISHSNNTVYSISHLEQRRILKKTCCYPYINKRKIRFWLSEYMEEFQIWVIIHIFGNKNSLGVQLFRKAMSLGNPRKLHYIYLKIKYRKLKEDRLCK